MLRFIVAIILVLIVAVILGLIMTPELLLPEAASAQAGPIDTQFRFHFAAIAFLFSLIVVLMVFSLIVFRRRKGETGDGKHDEGNRTLEIAWTIIPLIAVIALAFWGAQVLAQVEMEGSDPLVVNVTAQQWSWRFEYPDFDVTSAELVLPEKRQTLLRMSSLDVIHSFWVPEFRVKQDVLPSGKEWIRELRINPTVLGEYAVLCAELCGQQHSEMRAPVRVVTSADFDGWIAEEQAKVPEDPVERGALWATQFGCVACHSVDGSIIVGPSWKGICGST
ncbi:MAG: cytochrome c oxidase subunit II, partial [Anaerolineales bacterium]|nr:cytochrome c oxidase subunit II [Anaerolineales bacterium]